jgi:hypothetical protein
MERGLEGVQCSNGERNTKRKEGRSAGFTGTEVRGNSVGSGCGGGYRIYRGDGLGVAGACRNQDDERVGA